MAKRQEMDRKAIEYEITPEGGTIEVKEAKINLLPRSVSETTKVNISLSVESSRTPQGYVRASATLTCEPPIKSKKHIHIRLPTWFTTKASVDLSICQELPDSSFKNIDSVVLTDERFVDLQVKELSNITAYLSKERFDDVKVAVMSYLYRDAGGQVATAFKLSDKVFEDDTNQKFQIEDRMWALTDGIEEATVAVRDTLEYFLHSEAQAANKAEPEVQGQVVVDEDFLVNTNGHVAFVKLESVPTNGVYALRHVRPAGGQNVVVAENNYQLVWGGGGPPTVEFFNTVTADNIISNVGDVDIDQREIIDRTGDRERTQLKDDISYEKTGTQVSSRPTPGPRAPFVITSNGPGPAVKFHGKVNCKNMIGNATNVRIDQRRVIRRSGGDGQQRPPRQPVQADDDVPFPTKVAEQPDDLAGACELRSREPVEGKSESSRTFTPPGDMTKELALVDDEETMDVSIHRGAP